VISATEKGEQERGLLPARQAITLIPSQET